MKVAEQRTTGAPMTGTSETGSPAPARPGPRRILVLQTGRLSHCLGAVRAAAARYPSADRIGLIRQEDFQLASRSVDFTKVYPWPSEPHEPDRSAAASLQADLCVVPFEDRFGMRYWKFRSIPIWYGTPTVLSYNVRGRLRAWGRTAWILNSLLVCVGLRAIHTIYSAMRWIWDFVRRVLDVALLFGLGAIALIVRQARPLGRRLSGARHDGLPIAPRRVVLFIPSLGLGGAQRQLASYLKHIDRRQWAPEVVTLDTVDKFFEPAVQALSVPITSLNPDCVFWKVGVVWQLVRYLRANPGQVLHSWLHYAAALGAIAGTLAGVPTIIGSLRSERPGRFPWFYPKWQRGIDILTAPLQTLLLANSNAVREEHRRWAFVPDRKLLTVYNGVETDEMSLPDGVVLERLRTHLRLPAGSPCAGIVGRLSREKDHATFLRAASAIGRARSDVRFLIVGDGPMRYEIEADIKRLGMSEQVQVLGERTDALALIKLLDVLVLTSVSEGLPNVLLEAAVAGTPVVMTAAGGATEVVVDGETGFVVPCGDAEGIAGRVLELLSDGALRKRLIEASSDRVRKCFAANQTAITIQTCYAQYEH